MAMFLGQLVTRSVKSGVGFETNTINPAVVRPIEGLLQAVRQFDVDQARCFCFAPHEAKRLLKELHTHAWSVVSSTEQESSGTAIVVVDLVRSEGLPQRITFRVKKDLQRWLVLDWI